MAARSPKDPLQLYKSKRNFALTSEPIEGGEASGGALSFVVQKHWASRLNYDASLKSANQWTIRTAQTRLDQGNDPWKAYDKSAQTLTAAMKKLSYRYSPK